MRARDPRVAEVIEVRVAELKQLFNAIDASPFRERDLDPHAEEFIVGWAREAPRDARLTLLVNLDRDPGPADETTALRDAIGEFFVHRAQASRSRLRQLLRVGRTSLLVGLVFLAATVGVGDLIARAMRGQRLGELLRAGLAIGGWVAMWRPLEIFLYGWWPIRAEARLYDRLSVMPLRIAYKGKAAPQAWQHDWPAVQPAPPAPQKASSSPEVLVNGDKTSPATLLHARREFGNDKGEWRRLFAEVFGTFLLVLVAAGGGMVNARFGGHAIGSAALVTAPGLMVGAVILLLGSVSGAHLNPGVSLAFALRGDFPWRRVPGYIVAQLAGACLATLLLVALLGPQGTAGLTLPGPSISTTTAMLWETMLTAGLVSVILGTSSGAQNVGQMNAVAVAAYIALAGLWGSPVSGASMNTARSLGPALILGTSDAWSAYLVGPIAGSVIAVAIAYVLRGRGGGFYGRKAAQGGLGWLWSPGPIEHRVPDSPEEAARRDLRHLEPDQK